MRKLKPKNIIAVLFATVISFSANSLLAQGNIFDTNGKTMHMQHAKESLQPSLSGVLIPWSKTDLMNPDKLDAEMKNGTLKNTLILNIGSVNDIKSAVNIGPVSDNANLDKLKHYLVNVPKNKSIVIYCGCCPTNVCPNSKPAYNLLKKEGYTNFKVLDLEHNLNVDWISKGYPMKDGK